MDIWKIPSDVQAFVVAREDIKPRHDAGMLSLGKS
jgi:hypothetical protein